MKKSVFLDENLIEIFPRKKSADFFRFSSDVEFERGDFLVANFALWLWFIEIFSDGSISVDSVRSFGVSCRSRLHSSKISLDDQSVFFHICFRRFFYEKKEFILQLRPLRPYPNFYTLVHFVSFTILAFLERRLVEKSLKRRK